MKLVHASILASLLEGAPETGTATPHTACTLPPQRLDMLLAPSQMATAFP